MPSAEIYHYGVKGMKWGHRKSESRARIAREKKPKYTRKTRQAELSRMSDQELQGHLNRMRNENEYKKLTEHRLSRGERLTASLLKTSKKTASTVVVGAVASVGTATVMALIKGEPTPLKWLKRVKR